MLFPTLRMYDATFADQIARKCYAKYRELPPTGKPRKNQEWTHLAAIVLSTGNCENSLEVVSLGTGSKCIGHSKMSAKGDILNDSHAEVIARRAFLRYTYYQINMAVKCGNSGIVTYFPEERTFRLRNNISFHLFISHTPCGDASIFPKESDSQLDDIGSPVSAENAQVDRSNVLPVNNETCCKNCVNYYGYSCSDDCVSIRDSSEARETPGPKCIKRKGHCVHNYHEEQCLKCNVATNSSVSKKLKTESGNMIETRLSSSTSTNISGQSPANIEQQSTAANICEKLLNSSSDIHRTGAKCVPVGEQDLLLPGSNYHVVGAVRTKPGRGDRTLSLSCSDKLAKWNVVGIQGAILSHFLSHPIYLTSIVVGNCPYNKEALHRAIVGRVLVNHQLPLHYKQNEPVLLKTSIEFEGSRHAVASTSSGNITPCSAAIVWSNVPFQPLEVAVNGRKQGITKKHLQSPKARCLVSKKELFICFKNLLAELSEHQLLMDLVSNSSNLTYMGIKLASSSYQQAIEVFRKAVQVWPTKPAHFQQFDDES